MQWPSEEHLPKIPWENTWHISRIICQNRPKNIPKWSPAEGGHDVKKFFECSDPQGYTKNNCKKFCEKILNDSHQIKKHKTLTNKNEQNLPQNTLISPKLGRMTFMKKKFWCLWSLRKGLIGPSKVSEKYNQSFLRSNETNRQLDWLVLSTKGCVLYIFASLFSSLKESTCKTWENVFLFHFKNSFQSEEN